MACPMGILITLVVIIIVVALAIYAVDIAPLDPRLAQIAKLLIILFAVVYLLRTAGLV